MRPDGWLEDRLEGAPPELAGAIRALVRDVDAGAVGAPIRGDETAVPAEERAVPDLLAAAALRGFGDVLAETSCQRTSRRAALRLLAADAALTYAFEAAADRELDVVGLADRIGPLGALGSLLVSTALAPGDPRGSGSDDSRGSDESSGVRS